jgi:hypothetical protein
MVIIMFLAFIFPGESPSLITIPGGGQITDGTIVLMLKYNGEVNVNAPEIHKGRKRLDHV